MHFVIYTLVLGSQMIVGTSSPGSSEWTSNYRDAVAESRTMHRPLVVVLEDRSRSSTKSDSLDRPTVRRVLKACSVCRLDVRTPQGAEVAEKLNASSVPYTVVSDPTGRQIVCRASGNLSEAEWVDLLEDHIDPLEDKSPKFPNTPNQPKTSNGRSGSESAAQSPSDVRLVVLSTESCGYCDRLKDETFKDAAVKRTLRDGFEVDMIDATKDDRLAKEHGVYVYPSVLMLDQRGTLIDRIDGFVRADTLVGRLRQLRMRRRSG